MPTPDSPIPFQIPGYDPLELIGQGGFGRVYKAHEHSDLALVRAVKIIDPSPFHDTEKALSRFKREAKALSTLEHRAIVRYVASGVSADQGHLPYLVTEFVVGTAFRHDTGLSDVEIVEKMAEILDALAHAHSMGILHRDIKPSNLMVRSEDGQPIILDFGLAFLMDEDLPALTTKYAGSMGYVPPEVQSGEQKSGVNHDIFSCGVTLYEVLAGKRPDIQSPLPLSSLRAELAPVDSAVRQSLAPAATRFKNAASFASALRDAARRLQVTKTLSGSNPTAEAFRRKAIENREAMRKRQIEAEQQEAAARETWSAWNAIIHPAARQAFVDMLIVAKEVDEQYILVEQPEPSPANEKDVTPLLSLRLSDKLGEIVFGLSTTEFKHPLGNGMREEFAVQWPATKLQSGAIRGGHQVPNRILCPSWIVFGQARNQSPPRIFYGALVSAQLAGESEFRLFARPPSASFPTPAQQRPPELKTAEEIRKYITESVGRALVGF